MNKKLDVGSQVWFWFFFFSFFCNYSYLIKYISLEENIASSEHLLLVSYIAVLVGWFWYWGLVFWFLFSQPSFLVLFTLKSQTSITGLVLYLWYPLSLLVLLASCVVWNRPEEGSLLLSSLGSVQRLRSYCEHCFKGLKVHMLLFLPDKPGCS